MYRLQASAHLALARAAAALRGSVAGSRHPGRAGRRLRNSLGQGTVEYVALILLVALVMAGVVAAMKGFRTDEGKELGDVILGKIKQAVRRVQF
jgi:hypothetical protein